MRQPLPRQRARLRVGQRRLFGAGLVQQVAVCQKAQLRRHLEGLLCIAELRLEHQAAPACVVLAQFQRAGLAGHHLDAMLLLQAFAQLGPPASRLQGPVARQLLGLPVQRIEIVVVPVEEIARRLMRKRRLGRLLRIAVETVHQLLQLLLQMQLLLVQRYQRLGQCRHGVHHAVDIRGGHAGIPHQSLVPEDGVQLAQQAPVAVLGKIAQVHLEHLRQLEQHRRRHRPLVVLERADIAERQPEPLGKGGLGELVFFAQAPQRRAHQEFA
jgi:hypothetical protein